jgi:hypothetical protein
MDLDANITLGFRGAMVARLTPDQEVACSNHVEITVRCKETSS